MLANTIKKHMGQYSIHRKRSTTIAHAFASALSPGRPADDTSIYSAMALLGQDTRSALNSANCLKSAENWDHLMPLVKDKQASGFGHQLGNLVPACRRCNSSKGGKGWRAFLRTTNIGVDKQKQQEMRIAENHRCFTSPVDYSTSEKRVPELWQELTQTKNRILDLMKHADSLAERIVDDLKRS